MKAVMVMFDSLNRRMLPNYGCTWVHAPNFERLGKRAVTFDNCYVGSMPCMPARRELHTGRYNFLHRNWGPLEPFDDSMPEILSRNGVYTHLVSDHSHYWEDGGATYHTRYHSWEMSRGQEGDNWKGEVREPDIENVMDPVPASMDRMSFKATGKSMRRQNIINRKYIKEESAMPQAVTFANGLEFIQTNHAEDHWFLQIETFDPHEPFFTSERFRQLYPDPDYQGPEVDWPPYAPVRQSDEMIAHVRKRYAALLSMCDHYLGKVLDAFDAYDLWKDTLLIVNTDHGFMLGEHEWWAKSDMPLYNEVANIPLFIWDPRCGVQNARRHALVQTIDLAPTLLDFFHVPIPKDMQGKSLKDAVAADAPVRQTALYGYHSKHVNITDGTHCYMRGPISQENRPVFQYTLMPTHIWNRFSVKELQSAELVPPFDFTKGCKVLKTRSADEGNDCAKFGSKLFDLIKDPGQLHAINDLALEARLLIQMREMMRENDAPPEQYERLGIPQEGAVTPALLKRQREAQKQQEVINGLEDAVLTRSAFYQLRTLLKMIPAPLDKVFLKNLKNAALAAPAHQITGDAVVAGLDALPVTEDQKQLLLHHAKKAGMTH